jgi:hypothetical protein
VRRLICLCALSVAALPSIGSGLAWTVRNPLTSPRGYTDAVHDGKRFLLMGSAGAMATSATGIEWNSVDTNLAQDLLAAASSGTRTVLVGTRSAWSSDDARGWNPLPSWAPPARTVLWTGKRFLAGGLGDTLRTSDDGLTWSFVRTGALGMVDFNRLALVHGKVFAWNDISGSRIFVSDDGLVWGAASVAGLSPVTDIAWQDSTYLALGTADGLRGTLLTSPDGSSWTRRRDRETGLIQSINAAATPPDTLRPTMKRLFSTDSGTLLWVGDTTLYRTKDGIHWTLSKGLEPLNGQTARLVQAGGLLLDLRNDGGIRTSSDGKAWTLRSRSATRQALRTISVNGPLLVAAGDSGALLTSLDGKDWTPRALGTTLAWSKVLWNGKGYLAIGDSGLFATSMDGIDWSLGKSTGSAALRDVVWTGSMFVTVAANDQILTSPNAKDWTTKILGHTDALRSIAWSGSLLTVAGDGGLVFTSANAVDWNNQDFPTTANVLSLCWTGRHFLAGLPGALATSVDGISWSLRNGLVQDLRTIAAGGNAYAMAPDGSVKSSQDDSLWTAMNTAVQTTALAMAGNDSMLVQVGAAGAILTAHLAGPGSGIASPSRARHRDMLSLRSRRLLLQLEKEESVRLEILAPDGRIVKTLNEGRLGAGVHAFDLPACKGLYLACLRTGSATRTIKIPMP